MSRNVSDVPEVTRLERGSGCETRRVDLAWLGTDRPVFSLRYGHHDVCEAIYNL